MIKKKNYLNNLVDSFNFINDIPESELQKLKNCSKRLEIKKKDFFLISDEIPKYAGYNFSGLLQYYYIDEKGNEVTKHFCFEDTLVISFSAFVLQEKSKYFIQALEDTVLFVIDYKTYLSFLESHVCWQIVSRKISQLMYILKEKREYELLMDNAEIRYKKFLDDFPNIENRLTQYQIASYLCITPESLSRIRSNLI